MAVNTAQIKSLLLPGLYKVMGDYEKIETQWSKIFKRQKSTMATESSVQMRMLGIAQLKTEGGATAMDNNAGQRFVYNATSFEVGLGYAITRKSIDDNLYKRDFNAANLSMVHSFQEYKETRAANIFNNGTTYDATIGGDGKPLFATDHPYDYGTWANRPSVDADLNETSLLQGMINIRTGFKNEAGLKIKARAKQLLIPPSLEPTAIRLVKTDLRPGTANNDVNAITRMEGGGITSYLVNDYLTSEHAWFLLTNIDGFIMFERIPFETDMDVDKTTGNLLVFGYERYTPTYVDPRAAYGSFPTS